MAIIQRKQIAVLITYILFFVQSDLVSAQSTDKNNFTFGIEQDFLPYLTGGWFAGAWAGTSKYRVRILTARVKKPQIVVPDNFKNNWVNAYALLADYSINDSWKKWWVGGGLVFWDSEIETDQIRGSKTSYQNMLVSGSLGYNRTFKNGFYISPWAALHIKIAGDHTVRLKESSFTTPFFNPEVSLKIGWYFL